MWQDRYPRLGYLLQRSLEEVGGGEKGSLQRLGGLKGIFRELMGGHRNPSRMLGLTRVLDRQTQGGLNREN